VLGQFAVSACQILRGCLQPTVRRVNLLDESVVSHRRLLSSPLPAVHLRRPCGSRPRLCPHALLRPARASHLVKRQPEYRPGSRDSSVEAFQHLVAARDDALLRKLYHPCSLCVAPIQPEEPLLSKLGLALKPVSPRPVHVGFQRGGLPHVVVVCPHISRQYEHPSRRLHAEQATAGSLLDHERVWVVDAEAYLVRDRRTQGSR